MKTDKRSLGIFLAACSLHATAAITDSPSENLLIDGSYIVTFKPTTRFQMSPILPPSQNRDPALAPPKFGEHSTGQSKVQLANALGIRGMVGAILESTNAAHLLIDAADAEKLRSDPRVLRVEQSVRGKTQATQIDPGWALDRLDQSSTTLNSQYSYGATGTGRTIYILDSGLDLTNPIVAAEFGGRASVIWDVNGGSGVDCRGHGTKVASAAAGNTHGIAKGATVIAAKITIGCTGDSSSADWAIAFNWLAQWAPKGTIANFSSGLSYGNTCPDTPLLSLSAEDAIRAAHNKGIIIVVAAGNDQCDVANYTPTRMPEAFVVAATIPQVVNAKDVRAGFSRKGANISTFAPGQDVSLLNYDGEHTIDTGTSFAAPYIAGIFAVGCERLQATTKLCTTMSNAGQAYSEMRNIGVMGAVIEFNGNPISANTPSRFISKVGW